MNQEIPDRPPLLRGFRGVVYVALGCFFVGLGVLGAMLPVLPTTPFLLLASFFFIRSSPRLNDWLLRSPLFGPFLRDWHERHGVRLHVKITAITMMVLVVAASIFWRDLSWPFLVALLVLAAIGMIVVLRLPLVRNERITGEIADTVLASPVRPGAVIRTPDACESPPVVSS